MWVRMKKNYLLLPVLLVGFSSSVQAVELPSEARERPFRMGYLSLNADYNEAKPLAMSDAGFVVNSGVLVGSFDDRWIGGVCAHHLDGLGQPPGTAEINLPPPFLG